MSRVISRGVKCAAHEGSKRKATEILHLFERNSFDYVLNIDICTER